MHEFSVWIISFAEKIKFVFCLIRILFIFFETNPDKSCKVRKHERTWISPAIISPPPTKAIRKRSGKYTKKITPIPSKVWVLWKKVEYLRPRKRPERGCLRIPVKCSMKQMVKTFYASEARAQREVDKRKRNIKRFFWGDERPIRAEWISQKTTYTIESHFLRK